jgi:hypothetical protein
LIAVSRSDPHHGRWILPLVIAGLVGFTYLFVNALPPAPVNGTDDTVIDGGTGTVDDGTGTDGTDGTGTDGTTTSTTIAADVQAFVAAVDDFAARTATLAADAQRINDDWDARTVGLTPTADALTQLQAQTSDLASEINEVAVPDAAADVWATVTASAATLNAAALDMYDGLVNSDTAEQRLAALETYVTTAEDMAPSFEAAKTAVGA